MNPTIEAVTGSGPLQLFRWKYILDSPSGRRVVECEGILSPGLGEAVLELTQTVARQEEKIQSLKEQLEDLQVRMKPPAITPPIVGKRAR